MEQATYTHKKLQEILEGHQKWLDDKNASGRADFCEADLFRADLRGANLSEADLSRVDLRRAYLSRADLRGAGLIGADLYEADLRGADLRRADLSKADLSGADLREADLSEADLSKADLSEADLRRANLHGTKLHGADLHGADLSSTNVACVKGQYFASIGNIGSRGSITVYHIDNDQVFCGCFRGTLQEFSKRVRSAYPDPANKYRKEYEVALSFFEMQKTSMEICMAKSE